MNDDIVIKGIGSFQSAFVKSMSKDAWVAYMLEVNPKFIQAEEVWLKANPEPIKQNAAKKKKEDVPNSNDQL